MAPIRSQWEKNMIKLKSIMKNEREKLFPGLKMKFNKSTKRENMLDLAMKDK